MVTFDPSDVIEPGAGRAPDGLPRGRGDGRGYRVSGHFPEGDLPGEIELISVEELAAGDVTRIILRDPDATDEDFIALAERLGLHGVSYFVG